MKNKKNAFSKTTFLVSITLALGIILTSRYDTYEESKVEKFLNQSIFTEEKFCSLPPEKPNINPDKFLSQLAELKELNPSSFVCDVSLSLESGLKQIALCETPIYNNDLEIIEIQIELIKHKKWCILSFHITSV